MTKMGYRRQAVRILGWVFGWYKDKHRNYKVPDGFEVHHIDGDWTNNSFDNLVVLTKEEHQAIHRENNVELGKKYSSNLLSGGHNKRSVLCIETGIVYESLAEAGDRTGIPYENIGKVCRHKRKTAGGYTWRYIEE